MQRWIFPISKIYLIRLLWTCFTNFKQTTFSHKLISTFDWANCLLIISVCGSWTDKHYNWITNHLITNCLDCMQISGSESWPMFITCFVTHALLDNLCTLNRFWLLLFFFLHVLNICFEQINKKLSKACKHSFFWRTNENPLTIKSSTHYIDTYFADNSHYLIL